jgi:hypothetical protein
MRSPDDHDDRGDKEGAKTAGLSAKEGMARVKGGDRVGKGRQ